MTLRPDRRRRNSTVELLSRRPALGAVFIPAMVEGAAAIKKMGTIVPIARSRQKTPRPQGGTLDLERLVLDAVRPRRLFAQALLLVGLVFLVVAVEEHPLRVV